MIARRVGNPGNNPLVLTVRPFNLHDVAVFVGDDFQTAVAVKVQLAAILHLHHLGFPAGFHLHAQAVLVDDLAVLLVEIVLGTVPVSKYVFVLLR